MDDVPGSPHLIIDKIEGELYCGFAEHDHAMSPERQVQFRELLQQHCAAKWQVEIHPGTGHGFAFRGRLVYHEQASELWWERTFAMFGRQLRG